jgi:hypothetical protein
MPKLRPGLTFFFHDLIVLIIKKETTKLKETKLIACIGDVGSTLHCRYLGRTSIHPSILFLPIICCFGA